MSVACLSVDNGLEKESGSVAEGIRVWDEVSPQKHFNKCIKLYRVGINYIPPEQVTP